MKKITFIFLMCTTGLFAQIPNAGFENLNSDNTTCNWGNVYMWSGNDSIVWDNNWFYASTTDAHSGQRAIELSNAYNYTTGNIVPGAIVADTDSVYMAWGGFEIIPVTHAPLDFGFYCKFIPQGNDLAFASLELFDSMMTNVGSAYIVVGGMVPVYTYFSAPVNYAISPNPQIPAFACIKFSNCIPGGQASFGTRLLIDDVTFGTTASINESADAEFSLYPNPATDVLNVNAKMERFHIYIYNASGQVIQILPGRAPSFQFPLHDLPPGIYTAEVSDGSTAARKKFIVTR